MGHVWDVDKEIREASESRSIRYFIETGSYRGDSLAYLLKEHSFDSLFSIELSPKYHKECSERFADESRIEIIKGASEDILPSLLSRIFEPCIFWLDAHWSLSDTARGPLDCPLLEELEIIRQHEIEHKISHVILIDDYHIFGTNRDSEWVVTEDDAFIPVADWSDITIDNIVKIIGKNRSYVVTNNIVVIR